MLLHLPTLVKRKRTSFFQETRRQSDLPNVVHEPSEMGELLFSFRKAHPHCDVPRVDRNRCRVARGVLISRIEMNLSGNTDRCAVGSARCTQIPAGKTVRMPTLLAGSPEGCLAGTLEYRVGDVDHPDPGWWSGSALADLGTVDPDPEFADRWSDDRLHTEVERLEQQVRDRLRVER